MNLKLNRALKQVALNQFDFAVTRCDPDQQRNDMLSFFRRARPMATEHALIRIGSDNDGGYLLPDDLQGITTCYSPGVSTIADFELDLAGRGVRCLLADHSVQSAPVNHPLISFEKKFLGGENNDVYMTLSDWVARHSDPDDHDLLLQMDIENSEYDVLIETPREVLRRFRILAIEFHCMEALFTPMGYRLINAVFTKLLRDFVPVHVHPNNCFMWQSYNGLDVPTAMEYTFLRRSRIRLQRPATQFPHALDRTNVPAKEDFALPACWYDAAALQADDGG